MTMFDEVRDRSGTLARKWENCRAVFGRDDLLPLWVADMDFPSPQPVIDALMKRMAHGIYGYPMLTNEYWQALIDWQQRRHNIALKPDWLVPTPAVVTALSVAVQSLTEPGDEIIVQPPVYPPFFSVISRNGRRVVENPLRLEQGRYVMDLQDLTAKITPRTRMLILCSPHNPVGRVWEQAELAKLAQICRRSNLIVLSDEMHEDLVFSGHRHLPLLNAAPEFADRIITFVAPAKTFNLAAFYTSATIIPDDALRNRFIAALEALELLHNNLAGLVAAEAAYRHGEAWLDELLPYLEENAAYLQQYCIDEMPEISVIRPEGTYLAWLDCRELKLAPDALREFLVRDAKVGLNDGSTFGSGGEGFVRLNFGCPRITLHEGLTRIRGALKRRRK